MLSLQNAESGYSYKIKNNIDAILAQKLALIGLYKGSYLTKLDLDDISYPTVKVDTKDGVKILSGHLAKHITARSGSGAVKPFYEFSPQSTIITQSLGSCNKNISRLNAVGIKEKMRLRLLKNLPHMEYVVTVNHKNRVRIPEAIAAVIIGKSVQRNDFQFSFASKGVPVVVTTIAAGKKITNFLNGVDIKVGSEIILEGIESGKRIDLDPQHDVVIYTHEGLIVTMSNATASMIEVE